MRLRRAGAHRDGVALAALICACMMALTPDLSAQKFTSDGVGTLSARTCDGAAMARMPHRLAVSSVGVAERPTEP